MPLRVHALLVVRPDGRTPAAYHLRRTLASLRAQTRPVDVLTIVVCGDDPGVRDVVSAAPAEGVITAPASTRYAEAVALATRRLDGDAVWLLAQDTAPEPDALERLAGILELSPTVAYVAPKVVRWDDRTEIVSLGVTMSRGGRAVGVSDGELDQGQHDAREDALGADVRGILVRSDRWRALGGLDRALLGADEGLDLGIRARLAGDRVSLVSSAVVATAGDGVAGEPEPLTAGRRRAAALSSRTAQLHRRLAYAPWFVVPLHWLSLLPLAAVRSLLHLVRKDPGLIVPEWAASILVTVRLAAVFRARRRIAKNRITSWRQLDQLRMSRAEFRERLDHEPVDDLVAGAHRRGELRFFSGGAPWLVLGALVVSIAAFPALLAWPVLGGGGVLPLSADLGQLWAQTRFGLRAEGFDTIAPADPFAALVAIVGSFTPWAPSLSLVILWVAALPLAALGGWFAATRLTERSSLRMVAGVLWALAPTFLAALTTGRPAAVLLHLLLPWLFVAGSVAHRSWTGAGMASLLVVAVAAASPSLVPALVVLWFLAMLVVLTALGGRGASRLVWVIVPLVVFAAPLIWRAIADGDGWALLADPGAVWTGAQVAADAAGRTLLVFGIPAPDLLGWTSFLGDVPSWWVPLLAAPVLVLALLAPVTRRWPQGVAMLVITTLGLGTAFAAVGIAVSFAQSIPVAIWPGAALSLAWLGLVGGATVTLEAGLPAPARWTRVLVGAAACLSILVLAVPALTAVARGTSNLTDGPASTLPAYVSAEGRGDPNVGTMILTPQNDGGLSARVVWGATETLDGQATSLRTRTTAAPADVLVAEIAADLVTSSADGAVEALASRGVGFVLLASAAPPESDIARGTRLSAANAIAQRGTLDGVGETARGTLWRITPEITPRPAEPTAIRDIATGIAISQLVVVGIALLLAVPTAASRREARRTPRTVGPTTGASA